MNSDELIQLPDNRPWRLVNVERIKHTKNGFYNAVADFQPMKPWLLDDFRDGKNQDKLKSFESTYYKRLEVNLEYIRGFPIGSIWQKGFPPIIPSYFGEFSMKSNLFDGLKPTFHFIEHLVNAAFVPSQMNGELFNTDCLVFEPNKSLFAKKQSDGTYVISKKKGGRKLSFVKFFGYEIYRYFLTSRTEGTLNHRMLSSRRHNNLIYDQIRTKIVDEKRQVFLKKEEDYPNLHLIGNAIYDEKYKFAMRRIISRVSTKGIPERIFEGMDFPFDTFSSMKIYAKLVQKKEEKDEWGLVVYQIAEAKGYQKRTYYPVTERSLASLQKDGNVRFKTSRSKNKNKPKEHFENDPVNGDGDDDVAIEDNTLFGLMNPPLDKGIPPMNIEIVDDEGKVIFIGKRYKLGGKNKVGPSGDPQDPDGLNVTITLESMNYFPLFSRVIDKVRTQLLTYYSKVDIKWFDSKGNSSSSNPNCKWNYQDDEGNRGKVGYGCVEIKIGGNHFYLCEKESGRVNSENRSWLFAFPKYRRIKELEFQPVVEKFIFDPDRSWQIGALTEEKLPLNDRLNHKNVLPERLVVDEDEMESFRKMAIEDYSRKICAKIKRKLFQ